MSKFVFWKSCVGTILLLGIVSGLASLKWDPRWVLGVGVLLASYYLVPRSNKRPIPVFLSNLGVGVLGWIVYALFRMQPLIFRSGGPAWGTLWTESIPVLFGTVLLVSAIGAWVITMTAGWSQKKREDQIRKSREERNAKRVHKKKRK